MGRPGELRRKLRDLHRELKLKGSDLSFETCREQLLESVNLYPKTTIVLDALDECKPESRYRLVDTIDFLMANARHPLRVFISSRPDADIRDRFLSRPHIAIQATDNQDDIEKFVNKEIAKHLRWNKMSPALRGDILKTLLNQSSGMFQWANLQIKQLLNLETSAAIRDRLGKLPHDLKEAYDEIYAKIATRNEHDRILADRAFMWVICAAYPLRSSELLSAILPDPDKESLGESEEVDDALLLNICNNLLVLDPQRKVWQFPHLSVAEYFEEHHFSRLQADCYVTKVCLVLLISCDYQLLGSGSDSESLSHSESHSHSKPRKLRHPKHNLQIYARHHWLVHIKTQVSPEVDSVLIQLLKSFLGSMNQCSSQCRYWLQNTRSRLQSLSTPMTSFLGTFRVSEIPDEATPLWAMCLFSSHTLLSDWWESADIALIAQHLGTHTPVGLAARADLLPVCEALLKQAADVGLAIQPRQYSGFLMEAIDAPQVEIVKILLERGADANLDHEGHFGSPLVMAAADGNTEVVELLLKSGADVNQVLQTGHYGSALAAAAASRNTKVVELLLKSGADVNQVLQTGYYGSALAAAAASGDTEAVKLFLKSGAEVNQVLQTGDYGSALAAAAASQNTKVIELLLKSGADVNQVLQTRGYSNALAAAVASADTEAVELLLKNGTDVNQVLQTGHFGSALAAAVASRNTEVVELLLKSGADVNQVLQTGGYGSALAAAAASGDTEVVELLLKSGADVNQVLQTGDYGSALAAAATYGDTEVVELLLKSGADVNQVLQTGDYGSALAAAATYGDIEVVELLLKGGADVNQVLQTGRYGTALAVAAYWGRKRCAEDLIAAGADINLKLENKRWGTALQAAQLYISDDQKKYWWDRRDEEERKRDKADVVELLGHHAAAIDV
ncbi:ankyrin repeat-containing domain protein [Lasiosphaeria ovina]|uniref:Ankyrin repeat-containing domain protein n=1 Tax=Lasiosphaeria ovina TaxID=92902 RepID=A0AAE0K3T2_9PEZI|nr:ankyrin repeat-containing domain protein [Lasiosphaeria ovina]